MSILSAAIVSILTNATLFIFAAALVLLVLWQNANNRSNRYFGLCMVVFMAFGGVNLLWSIAQRVDTAHPERLLYGAVTLYITGIMLLFNFVISFAGLPRYIRWIERAISIPLAITFLVMLWSGEMFTNPVPLAGSSFGYRHDVTELGQLGIGIAVAYLLSIVGLLFIQRSAKAHEVFFPVAVLVLGVLAFSATQDLRTYSLNAIAVLLAIMLLGRLVLKYEVFVPLANMNAELTRKNEELAQATQMKSQFLANMSHELRTPLNSIIGYAELVTSRMYGELTPLQEDRLQKVVRNGHLLLALINDVLDLSKIEAGRLYLTMSTVDVNALLDSVLDTFESQAQAKNLRLVRGYGPLPPLHGDEGRIRQILANLVSNAIKFTSEGVVIVRGHFNSARQQVILTVTDTGIGIAPGDQDRVFDAFHHADGSLSRQHEGTGLGLAIARRLTEMHGGSLWFESARGHGSSFHVALPTIDELDPPPLILEPRARVDGPVIVAMDSDYESLRDVQRYLESDMFRVYGAHTGNDGLRLVYALKPVLVLFDPERLGDDGPRVLDVLRHDPATRAIPILMIASDTGAGVPDGALRRPFERDDLVRRVHRQLVAAAELEEERV
ncbi:MAG: hypothetical protein GX573_03480 [Chloroflexi bacterium]|nr:hypothetical protein [Chloroflexota bacterium]